MASVLPTVLRVPHSLNKTGSEHGLEAHSESRLTTFKSAASLSSRRRTLDALEQRLKQRRTKDILHLLKEGLSLLDCSNFDIDPQSYGVLLKSCTEVNSLLAGQYIHQHISANGYDHLTFLCNLLIEMYGKCGSLDEARFLFDTIDEPNVFSWTIIIAVYAHNGCFEEAYKIFQQMQDSDVRPNEFTFSIILGTIVSYQGLVQGRHIHACAVQNGMDTDAVVGTALINMYGKCTCVKDAALVFCKIQQHDIVAWNAIIAILLSNKEGNSALDLFYQMLKTGLEPDAVTFASILGACADQQFLGHGEIIHSAVVSLGYMSNLVVANALIDMYGKCGSPSRAGVIFSLHPDVISWTAIIVAYLQHPRKAIQLFKDMLQKGLSPNEFTYASVLTACTSLGSLSKGQIAHHCIIEDGLETNIVVATALLRMYGTCFTMSEALWIFDQLHERDVVLWNAIITIHAQHSLGKEALDLLQQMQQDGHEPDEITFSSVLSACSRAGLVEECCALYSEMSLKYKIVPTVEHCGCMVDLFGRASLLQEAVDFIETMHLKPNFVVWEIFLNSCTLYADKCGIEYAKRIRKELTSRNLQEASAARDNVPV